MVSVKKHLLFVKIFSILNLFQVRSSVGSQFPIYGYSTTADFRFFKISTYVFSCEFCLEMSNKCKVSSLKIRKSGQFKLRNMIFNRKNEIEQYTYELIWCSGKAWWRGGGKWLQTFNTLQYAIHLFR